jgi:uncharacterized protein (DUF362 family)/Pyruvate/2-oxoacid:ferredoxin oxidoreductase delta subunit
MNKTKVAVVRIGSYKKEELNKALKRSLSLLGGLENIFKPKSKAFVKINHLSPPSPAESAIVTNPLFTKEVLLLLKDLDLDITVGDDIQSKGKDGFLISGYRRVCTELGINLVNLKEKGFREIECRGQVLKKVYISPLVLDADYILNLPKLKTHSFTAFTGAVKNMFGVIPHGLRLSYHSQFPRNDVFSQMLVDIFSCVPPHLTIMDGIEAMEGEGPASGNPRIVGVILASRDAVAVDAVATKIIGFDPLDVLTNQNAHQRGLGTGEVKKIEIAGDEMEQVEVRGFKHSAIAVGFLLRKVPAFLYSYFHSQLIFIPEVIKIKCTACLECVNICPARAAKLDNDRLACIDERLCLHCMCCHEVCRFKAIKLRQRPVGRIIRAADSMRSKLKSFRER